MSEIVALDKRVATVRGLLEKSKPQIALALPRHLSADRMLRIAMTSIQRTPKLLECNEISLVGAIIQAAQLGLEPDGVLGYAYLVPYGKIVQLIPGYKGLVQLARRSGEISTIMAHEVRRGDNFRYQYGANPILDHTPSDEPADARAITHFYAVARLKDGGVQFEVLTKAQTDAHRDRYSKAAKEGPWVTEYVEMGKKTALRRLCKLLPASIELQRAVALDELAEIGIPQDLELLLDGESAPNGGKQKALEALSDSLRHAPARETGPRVPAEAEALETATRDTRSPISPAEALVAAIEAERQRLEKPFSAELWAAIKQSVCQGQDLERLDPAVLSDLFDLLARVNRKEKAAIEAVNAIYKSLKGQKS